MIPEPALGRSGVERGPGAEIPLVTAMARARFGARMPVPIAALLAPAGRPLPVPRGRGGPVRAPFATPFYRADLISGGSRVVDTVQVTFPSSTGGWAGVLSETASGAAGAVSQATMPSAASSSGAPQTYAFDGVADLPPGPVYLR